MKIKKDINVTEIITAFEPVFLSGFTFNGENHNFWEFVYVIDGAVVASSDEKVYELRKNEIIFHKPMEFHKLHTPQGEKSHLFIASFYGNGKKLKKLENSVFLLNHKQKSALFNLIDFLRNHYSGGLSEIPLEENTERCDNYNLIINIESILQPIACLMEFFLLSAASEDTKPLKPIENKETLSFNKIIKTLENNLSSQLSIPDIAKECNLSISSVNKIFAKYSSCGIHRYFIKLKIMKAIELLSKDVSVFEISEELGFDNQNYFSLVFKRETGYSPLNYKKSFIEKK